MSPAITSEHDFVNTNFNTNRGCSHRLTGRPVRSRALSVFAWAAARPAGRHLVPCLSGDGDQPRGWAARSADDLVGGARAADRRAPGREGAVRRGRGPHAATKSDRRRPLKLGRGRAPYQSTRKPGAGGLTNGSSCTTTSECQTGSYCQGGTCTDASAIAHASEGQPCNLQGTPVVGCVGDLICQETSPPKPPGTCMAPPGAGQPCALAGFSGNVCAAGNTCSTPTGGTCMTTVDAGTSPPLQPGGACSTQNTCQTALLCKSGACEPLGSTSCPANAPDGGAT
jgi:hypothetical protein